MYGSSAPRPGLRTRLAAALSRDGSRPRLESRQRARPFRARGAHRGFGSRSTRGCDWERVDTVECRTAPAANSTARARVNTAYVPIALGVAVSRKSASEGTDAGARRGINPVCSGRQLTARRLCWSPTEAGAPSDPIQHRQTRASRPGQIFWLAPALQLLLHTSSTDKGAESVPARGGAGATSRAWNGRSAGFRRHAARRAARAGVGSPSVGEEGEWASAGRVRSVRRVWV
jgi:hypothetical protein